MAAKPERHWSNLVSLLFSDALQGDRLEDHKAIAAHKTPVRFTYAIDDAETPRGPVEAAIALYDSLLADTTPDGDSGSGEAVVARRLSCRTSTYAGSTSDPKPGKVQRLVARKQRLGKPSDEGGRNVTSRSLRLAHTQDHISRRSHT